MLRFALIALVTLLVSQPASADYYVLGDTLYEQCSNSDATDWSYCSGYILGTIDAFKLLQKLQGLAQTICVPVPVNRRQLVDIVAKHLRDNPDDRHVPATVAVLTPLTLAFPCDTE